MRVVIADDSGIFRRGLRLLLEAVGIEVPADVGDVPGLLQATERLRPDACVVDVRMPPSYSDEGVRAAEEIRRRWPRVGALLLSTYADVACAERLLHCSAGGVGYLLKDRVDDVSELVAALRRTATGRTALDSEIVATLIRRNQTAGQLSSLTAREREVLQLMAQGLSNAGIGRALFVSGKTVETYVAAVFSKLGLTGSGADSDQNRRVLAVLAYLGHPT
ncbi:response regulator transcription factor [Geodermatophilus sp. SYSU D00742]